MTQRLTEQEVARFEQALRRARQQPAQDAAITDDILDALDRIGEGLYGRCELCREWLPHERLLAVPWTRHCPACAGQPAEAGSGAEAGRPTRRSADAD